MDATLNLEGGIQFVLDWMPSLPRKEWYFSLGRFSGRPVSCMILWTRLWLILQPRFTSSMYTLRTPYLPL